MVGGVISRGCVPPLPGSNKFVEALVWRLHHLAPVFPVPEFMDDHFGRLSESGHPSQEASRCWTPLSGSKHFWLPSVSSRLAAGFPQGLELPFASRAEGACWW